MVFSLFYFYGVPLKRYQTLLSVDENLLYLALF